MHDISVSYEQCPGALRERAEAHVGEVIQALQHMYPMLTGCHR